MREFRFVLNIAVYGHDANDSRANLCFFAVGQDFCSDVERTNSKSYG